MHSAIRGVWRLSRTVKPLHRAVLGQTLPLHTCRAPQNRNNTLTITCYWRQWSSTSNSDEHRTSASSTAQVENHKPPRAKPEASPWNVANAVTVGRLAAAPLTGYCIVTGHYDLALGGLLYAGASDWLDGYLARRLNLQTVIGSYLDPAADKLLVTTTTVCLAYQDVIPTWLAGLIIGRDVAIVVGYGALLRHRVGGFATGAVLPEGWRRQVRPLFISKVNTAMQIGLCFAGVASAGELELLSPAVVEGIGYITALTTTASGLSYGVQVLNPRRNG